MKKKVLLLLVLALVFSVSVVQAADKVTLRVVTMFAGADPVSEVYQETIEQFMAENPNIEIIDESATFDDSVKVRFENDFAAGNEPDITMYFTDAQAAPIVESGKVVPLDDLIADGVVGEGILPSVLEQVRYEDGNVYAIPITGFYEGLILNVDLFEKYDVDYPTSWEKLVEAIETFKANGVTPMAVGLGIIPHYQIEHSILKVGGAAAHDAGFENGIHPMWVEGLKNIKTLYDMGAFQKDTLTQGWEGARALFKQGEAAMIVEGSWAIADCQNEGANTVTMIAYPKSGPLGNPTDMIAGFTSGMYMSKEAYNDPTRQEAVLKLFKTLTSPAFIKKAAEANGGLPAAKVTPEGLAQPYLDGLKAFQEAEHISLPIDAQIPRPAWTEIVNGIAYICVGRRTPEEVLQAAYDVYLEIEGQ
ncbi:MAG: raffinose/stachyose/melibiose transport system substrate-binding protein [Halanaerobiales bacterium]|nr:raffinose/stachyose/melibiose transport system substrate-binding protein [Halanaerobiales bacterium]